MIWHIAILIVPDDHLIAQIVDGTVDLLSILDEVILIADEVDDDEVEVVGKKSDFLE